MNETQTVQFFGTPINVASLAKMRLLRLRVGKPNAERVLAWYTQMRDLAKQGSTFGQFTTNSALFVESIGGDIPSGDALRPWVEECAVIWDGFEAVDLIDILSGDVRSIDDLFRVEVLDFADTNISRATSRGVRRERAPMTTAERSAKAAENRRRVAAGMPRMSDVEAEEWLASRRATPRLTHATPRHADGMGWDGMGRDTPPNPPSDVAHDTPLGATKQPIEPAADTPLDRLAADTVAATQQRIATQLEKVYVNPRDAETNAKLIVSMKYRQTIKGVQYDIATWERAVNVMVRKVVEEGAALKGDPIALVCGILPSVTEPGSDQPPAVRSFDPDAPRRETPEEYAARVAEAAEAADREMAS